MTQLLRIAILECDTPIDPIKDQRGTYGDVFKELFDKSRSELEQTNLPRLEFYKYDVVEREEYPSLDKVDAILMTGSSLSTGWYAATFC